MKVLLSLTVTLALLLPSDASGVAQEVDGDYPPPPGSYSEGRYTVLKDGTLIYDGDIYLHFDNIAQAKKEEEEQPFPPPGDPSVRQATIDQGYAQQVEVCAEAGFPASARDGALPDTGGAALLGPGIALALAVVLVLISSRFRLPE